ncbi:MULTISPECIES: phosphoribosylformylglycinamidine synthase subunit PurS [Prochlorococcus]|uniref:phosphoribosylformylglycinamidine synthase subunit PurS n=1 Tax=Prochlorococcus TaxID=1218 RepID=UPI000533AA8C|nr:MULTISPECIES: phosphoribosylformylglycinamidine synthase subunit PurS [Prochlorococcus]KGG12363.1 Phosphoribosylformylglycinamidine synthase [Prochlorococcus sp. MIT 0601]
MSHFHAKVFVTLRPSVLDPAGEATRSAASKLGLEGINKLRIGKAIDIDLSAECEQDAQEIIKSLSDRLLANPVIENWTFELSETKSEILN